MEHVSIDLWAANLEPAMPNLQSWIDNVEVRIAHASERRAQMLVLPEFACAQWLSFAPPDLPAQDILGWLSECGQGALDSISELSVRYGISVLAGTIPFAAGPRDGTPAFFNRAWLLTADGRRHSQDKLSLTPLEAQGESGTTVPGENINVIDWNGLRVAIIICLDTEFTGLWRI